MNSILAGFQKFVAADKAVLVSTLTLAAVSLASGVGLHLNGSAVAVVSAIVAAGLGWFVHTHWTAKSGQHAK